MGRLGCSKKANKKTILFYLHPLVKSEYQKHIFLITQQKHMLLGAQWLSGRVLDSRPRGRGLEPHRHHCVVVLEQDTFILA